MFIKDWQKSFKSLAVWLPVVTVTGITAVNSAIDAQLIPVAWVPVVMLVTGFLGRAIKQKSISGDSL